MGLRAFGIGPFGSLLAAGRLNQTRSDSAHRLPHDERRLDARPRRERRGARRALGIVGVHARVAGRDRVRARAHEAMPPDTRVDSAVAREIAQREGIKAIVDGDVTGVPGGYIVSIRLVRADSGVELASFRETGDGPRGLIDAADKLARALRGKAGESLRAVNATPSLAQATTSSLDALRKYSAGGAEPTRSATIGRSASRARRSRSTRRSATAWSLLGATLSNYGGTQSAIDSALDAGVPLSRSIAGARARHGDGALLRAGRRVAIARKAIAAYEAILQRGDTLPAVLVNLGEQLRSRREFARAESLNVAAARIDPSTATATRQRGRAADQSGKAQGGGGNGRAARGRVRPVTATRHRLVICVRAGRRQDAALDRRQPGSGGRRRAPAGRAACRGGHRAPAMDGSRDVSTIAKESGSPTT